MYFGIGRDYALTLNEIGEEFNLTRERVRQIKEKAIRRLRHKSRSKSLRNYLGQRRCVKKLIEVTIKKGEELERAIRRFKKKYDVQLKIFINSQQNFFFITIYI